MRAHPRAISMRIAALPGASLFRSIRRDWLSWTRIERVSAVGLFLGAPLAVTFALGVQA